MTDDDHPPFDNPFQLEQPVSEDGEFFGRANEVGKIVRSAQQDGPSKLLLTGPRRIGKSSVLLRAGKRLSGNPWAYVDLQMMVVGHPNSGPGELARLVLARILKVLQERFGLTIDHLPLELTAEGFRESVLRQIQQAYPHHRLVVLLDEIEVLQNADRYSAGEVLAALTPDPLAHTMPPLVVVCEGRTWSQRPEDPWIAPLLKGAECISLSPFEEREAEEALTLPTRGAYGFSREAVREVLAATAGQPLFVAAMGWAICEKRRDSGDGGEVTAEDVREALEPAVNRAARGIEWAWDQMSLEEQYLVHAVVKAADLSSQPRRYVGLEEAIDLIQSQTSYTFKATPSVVVLTALIDNFIIEHDPGKERFRVRAPLLHRSIGLDSFEAMQYRQSHRVPAAMKAYTEGLRVLGEGDEQGALEHFLTAVRLNPELWLAAVNAARLEARIVGLTDGIARLRLLHHERPLNRTIDLALIELLTIQAREAYEAGTTQPELLTKASKALDDIAILDPRFEHSPEAEQLYLRIEIVRWERQLRELDPSVWRDLTERLATSAAGPEWWRLVLSSYCRYLREARPGESSMALALALAREVFPLLILRRPYGEGNGGRWDVPPQASEGSASLAEAWNLTLSKLVGGLSRPWDPPHERVPASLLEELLFLPTGEDERRKVRQLCDEHLARRYRWTLQTDPEDCLAIVRLLAGQPSMKQLRRDTEAEILSIDEEGDVGKAQRFFLLAPRLYGLLIDNDRALSHTERTAAAADYLVQIEFLLQFMQGSSVLPDLEETTAVRLRSEWRRLFTALSVAGPERAAEVEALLPFEGTADIRVEEPLIARAPAEQSTVLYSLLGPDYQDFELLDRTVPGAADNIQIYRATHNDEKVIVRLYRLTGRTAAEREFLQWLWENEYRALYNLSTRWEGRALAALRHARFDWKYQVLVMVTDFVGSRTLREVLDEGRLGAFSESRRGDLWRHLHALIEAVGALHDFGYMHRAIRPESILLDPEKESTSRAWFRLTNFEWSVYIYALAQAASASQVLARRRKLDYYLAPEALAAELYLNDPSGGPVPRSLRQRGFGEGFAADVYSLGLVMFECLVRLFKPDELHPFHDAGAYDQERHVEWLTGLSKEIDDAAARGVLRSDEAALISKMIAPEAHLRSSDLGSIAGSARRLSLLRGELSQRLKQRPLIAFTTLNPNDDSYIKKFLQKQLSLPADLDAEGVARVIEEELRDSYIYLSSAPEDKPLILQGKRVSFTAQPFVFDGNTYRSLAFLEVAQRGITAEGDWLGRVGEVKVRPLVKELQLTPAFAEGESWDDLFRLADAKLDGLGTAQRRLFRKVQLTVELEAQLWKRSIYQCEIVDSREEPDRQVVQVREVMQLPDPSERRRLSMAAAAAQSFDREVPEFDLSRSPDPTAAFREEWKWSFGGVAENGDVRLERPRGRLTPKAPVAGGDLLYIRPWSLSASRALYQRRQEVLNRLRDDAYLLRTVTDPLSVDHAPSGRDELQFFDTTLDPNKRSLVGAISCHRPLFLVQGPPGTGKTTLAREVILQTLAENPSARILVTSQAHEPLNNLLDKTEAKIEEELHKPNGRLKRKPVSVRLLALERLDVSQYGEAGTRIGRTYHPSAVARAALEQAAAWRPPSALPSSELGTVQSPQILKKWQAFLNEQANLGLSAALEERIVRGANLVYATANDRRLAGLREDSFDLVIYEEAARAYPIELLGPMRLARRWLLIGDQKQLPPFGIEDFDVMLRQYVGRVQEGHRYDPSRRGPLAGAPAFLGYTSAGELHEEVGKIVRFFEYLHGLGLRGQQPIAGALDRQWRMHPEIGRMVSEIFYSKALLNGDEQQLRTYKRHKLERPADIAGKPLVWLDVPPEEVDDLASEEVGESGGYTNAYEVRCLMGFLKQLAGFRQATALISPYRAQVTVLNRMFQNWDHPVTGPLVGRAFTVDSFQGRQADIVAVSLVRNNRSRDRRQAIGFLENESRSAVMFSRAEKLLIVVGCSKHFAKFRSSGINRIFDYIEDKGVVLRAYDYLRQDDIDAIHRHFKRYGDRRAR